MMLTVLCVLKAPGRDEKVDLHFVAFIEHNSTLYELGMYQPVFILIVNPPLRRPL